MDVVWLVLDSLGFEHTPFAETGPETMPRLATLAENRGVVYNRAFAPGPASPSSHASFLTGALPSQTGMHEAYPYFDGGVRTVPEALAETHDTYLTTVNPFLFNGLEECFDVSDDLTAQKYMIFAGASDPRDFTRKTGAKSGLRNKVAFLRAGGKPLRSMVNGLSFTLRQRNEDTFIPEQVASGDEDYQYANAINNKIRSYRERSDQSFILANYMDVHPPYSASEKAIERFAAVVPSDDLPVGVRAEDSESYEQDAMYALYRAAIWDLDRHVGELVADLVSDGAFVVVTADHGPHFGQGSYLTEERLHIPLVIFSPEHEPASVDHTVSLRSLPETTVQTVANGSTSFDGRNLLSVDENLLVVTEYIYRESDDPGPVAPHGGGEDLRYDFCLHYGETVLTIENGEETVARGTDDNLDFLRERARSLQREPLFQSEGIVDYDKGTEERLRDLGYL